MPLCEGHIVQPPPQDDPSQGAPCGAFLLLGLQISRQPAGTLRWHLVGGSVAASQLESDAQRRPARASAGGVGSLAPVVTQRHGVEAIYRLLRAIVMNRAL